MNVTEMCVVITVTNLKTSLICRNFLIIYNKIPFMANNCGSWKEASPLTMMINKIATKVFDIFQTTIEKL